MLNSRRDNFPLSFFQLERTAERDRETCDVRVEMERARLTACEERLRLRDELWTARQDELNDAISEARAEARSPDRREDRGPPAGRAGTRA